MDKRGQLGFIEFKFFIGGFVVGLIISLVLVFLGTKKIIPFEIPFVCGMFLNKKGQLGPIEAKYAIMGFFVGLIIGFVLVALGSFAVLPFNIPLVCG